jgi:signal recognition particle subunit SRP54
VSWLKEHKSSLMRKKQERFKKKLLKNEFGLMISFTNSASEKWVTWKTFGMIPGASKAMKDVEIEDDAFKHIEGLFTLWHQLKEVNHL